MTPLETHQGEVARIIAALKFKFEADPAPGQQFAILQLCSDLQASVTRLALDQFVALPIPFGY